MPETISMTMIWLGATILFLIAEGLTIGLTAIWFACGTAAALLASLFNLRIGTQFAAFVAVTAVTLLLTRPLARRLRAKHQATNADRVVSQVGVVEKRIDPADGVGLVHAGGKLWSACSENGEALEVGVAVRVVGIAGVKLIVVPQEPTPANRKEI